MLYDDAGFALALSPSPESISPTLVVHFGLGLADRGAVLALRARLVADGVELVEEYDEPDMSA